MIHTNRGTVVPIIQRGKILIMSNERESSDKAAMKKAVHDLLIPYPVGDDVLNAMQESMDSSWAAEPKSLFIGGQTGIGKSTLIEQFLQRHPPQHESERTVFPVLRVKIPSSARIKGTETSILRMLGIRKAKGTLDGMKNQIYDLIERCDIRMIIFDELQHIIDRDSHKILHNTSDWIKLLMEETNTPVVMAGLDHSECVITENEQLDRRVSRRFYLEPFGFTTDEEVMEFRHILNLIDERLPFSKRSGLGNLQISTTIHNITHGVLGYVMPLIRESAEIAINEERPHLSANDLNTAYNRLYIRKSSQKSAPSNPTSTPSVGEVLRT